MFFNSIEFIIFLPIVVAVYYLLPHKLRWLWLLVASYYFYMSWKAEYALLIIGSTVVDFFAAQFIDKIDKKSIKKAWLSLSLITNLGLLAVFKYYNFFRGELEEALIANGLENWFPTLSLLLPVGISFYTFQTLSYTLDVYYGRQKPEKHFGIFALYVSFFPQLVAGPIERFSHLGAQLKEWQKLHYPNIVSGLRLILYGLFVKMVVADNLSPYVDQVYRDYETLSSSTIGLGLVFYAFQIYADFFGYSTIAIGAAKLLGIDLMDNFKAPYSAISIGDFWKRWHISLTTWFREYLYLPLGGNRVNQFRWVINILIVFIVSGFWHGANWTFIIWGAIHGLVYLIENIFGRLTGIKAKDLNKTLQIFASIKTFLIVVLAWTFFRAESFEHATNILQALFANFEVVSTIEIGQMLIPLVVIYFSFDAILGKKRFDRWLNTQHWTIRWSTYAFLLFATMALGGVSHQPFIYFQF
jgi:D-alanyl-lipoteichoic acid acyltransferase DltB (MBOAT superfamily)